MLETIGVLDEVEDTFMIKRGARFVRGTGGRDARTSRYAFAEAMDALDADCDVMIFSDNVPVEQEIVLKDIAAQRGLIVMGPDCGTAIVGGVNWGHVGRVLDTANYGVGLVMTGGLGAVLALGALQSQM